MSNVRRHEYSAGWLRAKLVQRMRRFVKVGAQLVKFVPGDAAANYASTPAQGATRCARHWHGRAMRKVTPQKSAHAARPASWRAAHPPGGLHERQFTERLAQVRLGQAHCSRERRTMQSTKFKGSHPFEQGPVFAPRVTPNPSIERTVKSRLRLLSPASHVKR